MKKICQAENLQEASLIQGYLKGFGIETTVSGDFLSNVQGEVPYDQSFPEVHIVEESEYLKACKLVEEYFDKEQRDQRNAAIQSWNCPQCGKEHLGQFTECWNCQKD